MVVQTHIFGERPCTYAVLLELDKHAQDSVRALKQDFHRRLGLSGRKVTPAHITIGYSKSSETGVEDELTRKFTAALTNIAPFAIVLAGLNDWSHNLTWKIDNPEIPLQLGRRVAEALSFQPVGSPHLTLFRGIGRQSVSVPLERFELRTSFLCTGASLIQHFGEDTPDKTLARIRFSEES